MCINYIKSPLLAASLAASLVTMARRKISEEKARIEDKAAASLDTSKACDVHILQPRDVCLGQSCRVKARDSFTSMRLYHSSEALVERFVELILRDPSPRSRYSEGEILFVELGENATKWLLSTHVPLSAISARTGGAAGEIGVMVRGTDSGLQEWREVIVLALPTTAGFAWVQTVGLVPIPPEAPFSREPIQPAFVKTVIEEPVDSRLYPPAQPRKRQTRYRPPQPKFNVCYILEPGTENPVPVEPEAVQEHMERVVEHDKDSEPEPEGEASPVFNYPYWLPDWLPPDFYLTLHHHPDKYQLVGEFLVSNIELKAERPHNTAKCVARSPLLRTLSDVGRSDTPSSSSKSAASIQRSHRASRPHSRNKSISEEKETVEEARKHNLSRTRLVHHLHEEKHLSRQPSGQVSVPCQRSTSIATKDTEENVPCSSTPVGQRATSHPHAQQAPPPVPQIVSMFRAFLFTWSTNQWLKISPDKCKIVITPGRLEALHFAGSSPASPGSPMSPHCMSLEPLVFACDLNTALPVQRGTAVDISIRTPGKNGVNIMLRSRSPKECEMLFNAINAHCIMPHDYQLPLASTVSSLALSSNMGGTSTVVGSTKRGFGGWSRSKSCRSGGASNPSPVLFSSSISLAFSRFCGSKVFKSSPLGSVASSTSPMGVSSPGATPVGLPNVPGVEHSVVMMSPMKIRLYRRESSQSWSDLGNSRLSVFKPLEGQRGRGIKEDDKRVIITSKKGDKVHLDVVLGEFAFLSVGKAGIAISILVGQGEPDGTGKPGNGGGISIKRTVYMMQVRYPGGRGVLRDTDIFRLQMEGEAEAAYSFSILGKLRC